jgi:hypothetical protein
MLNAHVAQQLPTLLATDGGKKYTGSKSALCGTADTRRGLTAGGRGRVLRPRGDNS